MDPSATSVSKVVHLSNLPRSVTENDIRAVFKGFGNPAHIVILQNRNQALVEMEDLSAAVGFVNYHSSVACTIRDCDVGVEHSTHQALNRKSANPEDASPSRILLLTVSECFYPITIDVAHQILSPHGMVEKIVMFNKGGAPNTLHILAQFAHVESAKQALSTLQGQHVYQNACRLQIQFSKHEDLNVTRNGERTRDYLNPHLPSDSALLPTPPVSPQAGPTSSSLPPGVAAAAQMAHISPPGFSPAYNGTSINTCVLLVTNLNPEKTSPTALFNLFSLYGPVDRVKIFYNKPDQGLVQMGDVTAAQNAFSCLKGAVVYGRAMGVTSSKHRSINASLPASDEQGENLLADFDSRSQRFRDGASAKSITSPTSLLHCSNLAPDTTATQLTDHLAHAAAGGVVAAKVFEVNERTMGFAQFDSVEAATDTLAALHGQTLNGRPLRLAFSRKSLLKK